MKKTILILVLAVFLVTGFIGIASAWNDFGCTPGYWKQPQHVDDWDGYSTDDSVYGVFGCGPIGGMTLLNALKLGGGGQAALTRHAVAALLNQAVRIQHDGGTTDAVILAYCTAYSGDPAAIEAQKNLFEEKNDQDCSLGGSGRAIGRQR